MDAWSLLPSKPGYPNAANGTGNKTGAVVICAAQLTADGAIATEDSTVRCASITSCEAKRVLGRYATARSPYDDNPIAGFTLRMMLWQADPSEATARQDGIDTTRKERRLSLGVDQGQHC